MISPLAKWSINIGFALFVSCSYILYGFAFKRIGSPSFESFRGFVGYVGKAFFNPFFITALAMALSGTILRMLMFKHLGIARSALVAEISLIFMLVFSVFIFQESLRFPRDYIGMFLIMLGAYVVG